ncbi:MAG: Fe-S cluster assembly protein SufD [Terriglobia bacterium]
MATTATRHDLFLSHFARLRPQLPGGGQAWLERLRQEAIDRFAEFGFPTSRLENWKFTNVLPLARTAFQPAAPTRDGLTREKLGQFPLGRLDAARLVFVNGRFAAELSSFEGLPKGARVGSLAAALEEGNAQLEEHLGRYAAYQPPDRAFVALNTAFLNDGAFLEIPQGALLEKPIHLVFVSVSEAQPVFSQPRNLILVGAGAQAALLETYLGLGDGPYFTNAVTEIVAAENSIVDHYKFQLESEDAFHVATLQARQARDARFTSHNVSLGGRLVRNDVNVVLDGEGSESALNGLFVARGRQHVDNHTLADHAQPHCTSHELYQGVLDGSAAGVFNGAIIVRPNAQKTDAIQHNKNLLLSEGATINTKPQLEIFADDVRCTHGATVGQLDPDALFYLRSRGLPYAAARNLLIRAFASTILERMKVEALKTEMEELLLARLAGSQRFGEG